MGASVKLTVTDWMVVTHPAWLSVVGGVLTFLMGGSVRGLQTTGADIMSCN